MFLSGFRRARGGAARRGAGAILPWAGSLACGMGVRPPRANGLSAVSQECDGDEYIGRARDFSHDVAEAIDVLHAIGDLEMAVAVDRKSFGKGQRVEGRFNLGGGGRVQKKKRT